MTCLEDYPWRHFKHSYISSEDFDCHCARVEARFLDLGLPAPKLRNSRNYADTIDRYIDHLKTVFQVEHVGFKSCMHPAEEISRRIDEGYKVILMRRRTEDILKSWLRRIDPSLANASVQLKEYFEAINQYDLNVFGGQAMIIEFEKLTEDTDDCLRQIGDFLEVNISRPDKIYHSFARGRQEFSVNSSFAGSPESGGLRDVLESAYSEQAIARTARLIDERKLLGIYPLLKSKIRKMAYSVKAKLDSAQFQRVDW